MLGIKEKIALFWAFAGEKGSQRLVRGVMNEIPNIYLWIRNFRSCLRSIKNSWFPRLPLTNSAVGSIVSAGKVSEVCSNFGQMTMFDPIAFFADLKIFNDIKLFYKNPKGSIFFIKCFIAFILHVLIVIL